MSERTVKGQYKVLLPDATDPTHEHGWPDVNAVPLGTSAQCLRPIDRGRGPETCRAWAEKRKRWLRNEYYWGYLSSD